MKSLRVRRFSMTMNSIFVACLAFAAHGATNVFDDAAFWFRGGKDCVTVDGYMKQGEFFDDLHADNESHENHQMLMTSYTGSYGGFKENAAFQSEPVVFPALGTSVVKDMQVLHISNVGKKSNNKLYYYPPVISPHSVFESNNISSEYTIISRIRLDNYDRTECLFRIGHDSSAKQGMMLGFEKRSSFYAGCKGIMGYCTPDSSGSNTKFQFDLPVPTNTWVDLAVVVGGGKLRVGIAAPQSLSRHNNNSTNNPTIAFAETHMWTENCSLLAFDHYYLFGQNRLTAPQENVDSTFYFTGSMQQMAIWGRALNDQEVMAAFGMPRPAIFRTGFDNGASTEFGGTRTGSSQEIDALGSWQNVWNTMQANDTWTVNFTALRDEAGLPQIFSIKSLRGSAAQIEVELNGTSLGEGRVAAEARAFWPVAKDLIRAGHNELVVKCKGAGLRGFLIDAMELGGSLGVGMKSGSSTDDGRTEPERTATGVPSAADPNTQHWPQDLQPYTGITNLHLRVWVDPDMADKASFTFKTRVQGSNSPTKTMTGKEFFNVCINNANVIKCTTAVSASGLDWSREFQPGDLHGGWNDFEFICPGPYDTCRWLFDYFRFEAVLPTPFGFSTPPGLAVSIR